MHWLNVLKQICILCLFIKLLRLKCLSFIFAYISIYYKNYATKQYSQSSSMAGFKKLILFAFLVHKGIIDIYKMYVKRSQVIFQFNLNETVSPKLFKVKPVFCSIIIFMLYIYIHIYKSRLCLHWITLSGSEAGYSSSLWMVLGLYCQVHKCYSL